MIAKRTASLVVGLALFIAACTSSNGSSTPIGSDPAPGFATGVVWLNAPNPPSLSRLEGKVGVVYFFSSSCVSCRTVIDDVRRLSEEFPDDVVPLGVHSARFDAEADPAVISQFLTRMNLDHAVANDGDYRIWQEWGIDRWPTALVIDQAGNVAARHTGDGAYEALAPVVDALVNNPVADRNPATVVFTNKPEPAPQTVLAFPEAVLADVAGGRLFIADTGHHRLVVTSLESADVLMVVGSGEAGESDGSAQTAAFREPRGMALSEDGSVLHVADSGNHVIRRVDLATGSVTTLALADSLNYPWDIEQVGEELFVSVAGANQIWKIGLEEMSTELVVGAGRAGAVNGDLDEALFSQPSGLGLLDDGRVVVADGGSSSVRLVGEEQVATLAGPVDDLFAFGYEDGALEDARFQYPLGVTTAQDSIWVADTLNHRIRMIDAEAQQVTTVGGSNSGWRDGQDALFSSPGGIDATESAVFVADTGNHSIRKIDQMTGMTETVVFNGIELLVPTAENEDYVGPQIVLARAEIGSGPGTIVLDVAVPEGFKINPLAPSRFEWSSSGIATIDPAATRSIVDPEFPMEVTASFAAGQGSVEADLWLVYCESDRESICLFDRVRIEIPLDVTPSAATNTVAVSYEIVPPEL